MREDDRASQMAQRVHRTAVALGLPAPDVELIASAHRQGMSRRIHELTDDHDPAFLHPGRTGLILLEDLSFTDADWIAAGMLLDTGWPKLEVPDRDLQKDIPTKVVELRQTVPRADSGTLVEDLLSLAPDALDVALAERLDHLRHLHLSPDVVGATHVYERAVETYSVVATRAHPTLARRYAWWTRTFRRKFAT